MNLAQNINTLRKKNHWSQEEFAAKMEVSRQAVSKWESGLSTPDLEKLIRMSKLFKVSIDDLLEANLEDEEEDPPLWFESSASQEELEDDLTKLEKSLQQLEQENDSWHTWEKQDPTYHTEDYASQGLYKEESQNWLTLTEAQEFYLWSKRRASMIAAGVFLCILSPVPLFFLFSLFHNNPNVDVIAGGGGVCALLFLVALAVGLFIQEQGLNKKWKWLQTKPFSCDQEVKDFAYACEEQEQRNHTLSIALGVSLCVLSPIPLILGAMFLPEEWVVAMVGFLLMIVGMGVYLIVLTNLRKEGWQMLSQEGEYTPIGKRQTQVQESLGSVYWCVITGIYLWWSFASQKWDFTWIIWPLAAIAFGIFTKLLAQNDQ